MRLSLIRMLSPAARFVLCSVCAVAAFIAAALIFVPPALAADGSTVVDFGPLLDAALDFLAPTIGAVISLLAMWALQRVSKFLGLKIDDSRRIALDQGLGKAIDFAVSRVGDVKIGGIPINLKSQGIAIGVDYAKAAVPGALRHFGIERERLAQMVEARLAGVLIDPDRVIAEAVDASRR